MQNDVLTKPLNLKSDISTFGYKQELKRELSVRDLTIYGMLFMSLVGPMIVYGPVAQAGFGMVSLVYLIGTIAMLFTAISYSKLSREFPISGSVFTFVQRGVNAHIGFIFGWIITLDYLLIPAFTTILASTWLSNIVPSVPFWVWNIVFVVFTTIVNVRGVSFARRTNMFLIAIQIFALIAFLIMAFIFVFIQGNGIGQLSFQPFFQFDHFNLNFVATATSIAVVSFLGFDAISTMAEEAKEPENSIGKATIASLIIVGVLFMAQTYMAALIHPNYTNLDPDMGFFDIAREAGGDFLYYTLLFVNIIAIGIAVTLSAQAAIARIFYTMSRDKLLPGSRVFGKIHSKFKTPANATVFIGAVALLISLTVSLNTVIQFVNFGALTSFMMLNLTVIIYFFIKKKKRNTNKDVFNYLILPILGFLIIAYVWSGFETKTYLFGFSWALIGIIIGFVKSKGYKVDISKSIEI